MIALVAVVILGSVAVVLLILGRRPVILGLRPATRRRAAGSAMDAPGPAGPAMDASGLAGSAMDGPARLLVRVVGLLPAGRADWGRAMLGELEQLDRRSERWRFTLGCLAATLLLPARHAGAGRLTIGLVTAGVLGCTGLVADGLLRYPAILADPGSGPALAAFGGLLAGFGLLTVFLVRRGVAAGAALAGGLGTAVVWTVFGYVGVTGAQARPALSWLLLALPLAPLAVGVVAARHGRTGAAARRVALLSAMVTGLVLFLILAGDALLTAGGPYDAGQLRDFPGSRFPDMASYAVSDNLGTAMSLLLLASVVTAALGCAAATATARLRRAAEA